MDLANVPPGWQTNYILYGTAGSRGSRIRPKFTSHSRAMQDVCGAPVCIMLFISTSGACCETRAGHVYATHIENISLLYLCSKIHKTTSIPHNEEHESPSGTRWWSCSERLWTRQSCAKCQQVRRRPSPVLFTTTTSCPAFRFPLSCSTLRRPSTSRTAYDSLCDLFISDLSS